MYRTIIDPMEQMRDFDFVSFEHDVLVGLGGFIADVTSGLPATVLGGLIASQTVVPTLSINIASGRIYQFAPSDTVAAGSIAQDLTVIAQQGFNPGQALTLTAPAPSQSQWNVIQAQFSQVDAVRTNDPNGGVVPFYNAANPTQPINTSINTVRMGVCVLQVITGSAATTGSEVPPLPTNGWVPLYMIDLAGGQTQITTSQIITCGPSVGTGVPAGYPAAPFLAGLLASHHSGSQGQAPKIKLGSEVQGILPYANMSSVRTLLNSSLTIYVNASTGSDTNSGITPTAPFKTIQAAINAVYHNYDFNGFGCTISVANGSYTVATGPSTWAASFYGPPVGIGPSGVSLVGNIASPASVTIGATNGNAILASAGANITIQGITVTTTGTNIGLVASAGYGLTAQQGAVLTVSNCVIGSCGSAQLWAALGGFLVVSGTLTLTGTTFQSLSAGFAGTLWTNSLTCVCSSLTVTGAFSNVSQCGVLEAVGMTFLGTATGPKFGVSQNGVISTNGGGINYFPGSTAGVVSTGGQYN